jgi:hypothetical protein
MLYQKTVTRNMGVNRIARAVAQSKLKSSVLDQKIMLYMTDDGDECLDICTGVGMTLSILGYAAELDQKVKKDDLQVRILRGGLSALSQMSETNRFDRDNLVSIDKALDAAVDLNARLSPDAVNQAWLRLTKVGA